jgi:hypothetical protein
MLVIEGRGGEVGRGEIWRGGRRGGRGGDKEMRGEDRVGNERGERNFRGEVTRLAKQDLQSKTCKDWHAMKRFNPAQAKSSSVFFPALYMILYPAITTSNHRPRYR